MKAIAKTKYKYWEDGKFWLSYLEEFPDYLTQGTSLEELKENLTDLYKELSNGEIPSIRRVDELEIT